MSLVENVLRVVESKSEEGERTIALSPMLADTLADHYRRTAYKGDARQRKRGSPTISARR